MIFLLELGAAMTALLGVFMLTYCSVTSQETIWVQHPKVFWLLRVLGLLFFTVGLWR